MAQESRGNKLRKRLFVAVALTSIVSLSSAYPQSMDFLELAKSGTPQRVKAAIDKGADVNTGDSDNWTPLMAAAGYNPNPEVITTLLKAGADVNAWDALSMTALNWAAMHNQNPEVITALVKAGADLEARDIAGDTPLMFASWYNPNPEVVHTLLRAGADPKVQDHTDETALMLAARYGKNSEDLTMLLEAGADAKAKDKLGMTAFDYAKANEKLRGTVGLQDAPGSVTVGRCRDISQPICRQLRKLKVVGDHATQLTRRYQSALGMCQPKLNVWKGVLQTRLDAHSFLPCQPSRALRFPGTFHSCGSSPGNRDFAPCRGKDQRPHCGRS